MTQFYFIDGERPFLYFNDTFNYTTSSCPIYSYEIWENGYNRTYLNSANENSTFRYSTNGGFNATYLNISIPKDYDYSYSKVYEI